MRTLIILALAALVTAGCANPTPVEANFGNAVNRAKAAQVVDPDAPSRARPQLQVDGAAAKSAVDQYQKSFEAPTLPPTILNIGVGTTGSTGSVR